jgi:beta-galactosidase
VSGKVDGVRLPKELFFVSRVMQSSKPDMHIIGHWTYPTNTRRPCMSPPRIATRWSLFLNGKSLGVQNQADGQVVAQQELQTASEPSAIKLTLHTGPKGLQADGSDVALIDFEVGGRARPPLPDGRGARGLLTFSGPVGLARRDQRRQAQYHQQPLPRHGMRHQPRRHPLHHDTRHNHCNGEARRT